MDPAQHLGPEALTRDEVALRGQAFLAPLLGRGRARLRVRGLVCELEVIGAQPGWWMAAF